MKQTLSRHPLAVIEFVIQRDLSKIRDIENNEADIDLKRALREFSFRHPDLLLDSWIELAWDRVYSREIGLHLIEWRFSLEDRSPGIPVETSLDVISKMTGFYFSVLRASGFSAKSVAQFYELMFDIQGKLRKPIFDEVSFGSDVFSDRRITVLLGFLSAARDLLHLSGNSEQAWAEIVQRHGFAKHVLNVESLRKRTAALHEDIVQRVRSLFSGADVSFSHEQLAALNSQWGGLEAVYTLVSRFRGTAEWRNEIPVLAKVFSESLNGTFSKYKFEHEDAEEQLEMLKTDSQKVEWKKPRALGSLYDPAASTEKSLDEIQASRLEEARIVIRTNLLVNSGFRSGTQLSQGDSRVDLSTLDSTADSLASVQRLLGNHSAAAVEHSLLAALSTEKDLQRIDKLARALKIVYKKSTGLLSEVDLNQVTSDLNDILKLTKGVEKSAQNGTEIVLTVLSSDPKFLLTIGDLVQVSSCQNYKTGSYIHTLLGYVIDANVQGLASFALGQSNFASFQDFARVRDAYSKNQRVEVVFDGNKRIATFALESGVSVTTRPLGYAYLRQIVKLGASEGLAALVAEREYRQDHAAGDVMREQHQQVLAQLAQKIHATRVAQRIRIGSSRNPGGVYSDLAGGVKTGDYVIEFK